MFSKRVRYGSPLYDGVRLCLPTRIWPALSARRPKALTPICAMPANSS